jgi:hypothetical protein
VVDTPATTLVKEVHHGLTGGMNRAIAIHELPEGQHHTLYDCLLDNPGFIRQRGPVAALGSNVPAAGYFGMWGSTFSNRPPGPPAPSTPITSNLFGIMGGGATNGLYIRANGTNRFLFAFGTGSLVADDICHAAAALKHGTLLGRNDKTYTRPQTLQYHAGAQDTYYTTGTMTVARGSRAVVGAGGAAWLGLAGAATGGWFLVSNNWDRVYGVVASIDTNTTLTLVDPSPYAAAASTYQLVPLRQVIWKMGKGRITVAAGSAAVTGGLTKFLALNTTFRNYDLYRLSDMTSVGTVLTVGTDRTLTLAAGAAVSMSNERFVLIPNAAALYDASTATVTRGDIPQGGLTSAYAGRQFYANLASPALSGQSTIWFSDPQDFEMVDYSPTDGDFIVVASQGNPNAPITGMFGMQNGLAIFKDRELWMLSGDDPSNFVLSKVADVGTWTHTSIVPWRGTLIFAAREGILQFDGVRLRNLTSELADFYRSNNATNAEPCPGFVYRNHYVVWMNGMSGGATVRKAPSTVTTETSPTIVVNLETGAICLFSNCRFTGAAQLDANFGAPAASAGDVAYACKQAAASGPVPCSASALFTSGTAADSFTSFGGALGIGPNFYVETKAEDLGDPERMKYWKDVAASYFANGAALTLEGVLGIGTTTTGALLLDALPASGSMTRKRARAFLHGTHFRLRIYPASAGVLQNLNIGTFSLRGRPMRFTRVA